MISNRAATFVGNGFSGLKLHGDLAVLRPILALIALLLAIALPGRAQLLSVNNSNMVPQPGAGHDYIHMLSETVDPANGSVSIRINLPLPPGRGITLPFSIAYDSQGTFSPAQYGPIIISVGDYLSQGGWSYAIPRFGVQFSSFTAKYGPGPTQFVTCRYYSNFSFLDAMGGRRGLGLFTKIPPPANASACNTAPSPNVWPGAEITSNQDDLFQASTPPHNIPTLYTPSITAVDAGSTSYEAFNHTSPPTNPCNVNSLAGNCVTLADTITDRYGNTISIADNGSGAFTVKDDIGRTAALSSNGFGQTGGDTLTVSGLTGAYTVQWETVNYNYDIQWNLVFGGPPDCNSHSTDEVQGSFSAIQSITLPNGQQYTFTYDTGTSLGHYGLLTQIEYPSGGTITYTWGLNSQSAGSLQGISPGTPGGCGWIYDKPALLSRTVSFDDSTTALTQTFSYPPTTFSPSTYTWTSKQTTVQTTDNIRGTAPFETIYQYSPKTSGESTAPSPFNVADAQIPAETTVTYYKDLGVTKIRTVNKTWNDAQQMTSEQDSLPNGSSTAVNEVDYAYSASGSQVTDKKEYDFGSNARGLLLRETVINYQQFGTSTSFPRGTLFDLPCQTITKDGSNHVMAETDSLYDSQSPTGTPCSAPGALRGNLTTSIKQCLQAAPACSSGNPTTTYTYDTYGHVASMKDPCGNATCADITDTNHTTTYSYTDNPPGGNTNAYLTQITYPPTGSSNVSHMVSFSYNYSSGQLTQSKDQNLQPTSYIYNDSLARLTEVDYPDIGKTTYAYNDTAPSPTVTTTKKMSSTANMVSVFIMDGIGHPVETELTSDTSTDQTIIKYDGLGRKYQVYNPTRCSTPTTNCGESTWGYTTYTYDVLGRVTLVTNPDSTTVQTAYTGRAMEVTDEGNGTSTIKRISQHDGLGRLLSLCEVSGVPLEGVMPGSCGQDIAATGFLTTYTYDTLNNLLQVNQGTLNPRTFGYDSLSRLVCTANPEVGVATCPATDTGVYISGTKTYFYDANGNVASRVSSQVNQVNPAVTVTANYQYDALNRLTSEAYVSGTSTNTYVYDVCPTGGCPNGVTPQNAIGRLVQSSNNKGETFESYDLMGRVAQEWQCTMQNCGTSFFSLNYTYDLIGNMKTSLDSVSGVTLTYTYDNVAQLTTLTSSLSDANHPGTLFSSAVYNAPGFLTSGKVDGTAITLSRAYNSRLRLTSLSDGSVYSASIPSYAPNGDILTADDSVNGNWTYTYDDFNRLATSSQNSGATKYSYGYDRYGNRWAQTVTAGTGLNVSLAFDANNHISGSGVAYDAAGNVKNDGTHAYTYDAENRIIMVDAGSTATYEYDAKGHRVRKTAGGTSVDYLYDLAGRAVTEVSSTGGWNRGEVYAGGKHLATYSGGTTGNTYFTHTDWLGTERVRSTVAGASCETVTSLPFGDNMATAGTCGDPSPLHFTGKQRDNESNLDDFGARYFSSSQGRWQTPDWSEEPGAVPYATLVDPQTLNLYAYVGNNPVADVDSNGHVINQLLMDPTEPGQFLSNEEAGCLSNRNLCDPGMLVDEQSQAQNQSAGQPAPTNPDGSPKPPTNDVPKLPDGKPPGWKPGDPLVPNEWEPKDSGKGNRDKWGPKYPIPGGSQPGVSWDPAGHWDHDDGNRNRTRWLPGGGGQVDHNNNPVTMMDRMRSITPGPILKWGTAGVVIYIIIDEGSRLYPPRNLVPVP